MQNDFTLKKPLTILVILLLVISGWLDPILKWVINPPVVHAATVPNGVIIAWPGTNAAVSGLTGWSRATTYDTYYFEGTTSDPSGTAGGAATHSHTSPSHTHTIDHNHTGTILDSTGGSGTGTAGGSAANPHQHTITLGTNTDSNVGQTANLGTASNDPPYTKVIWLVSDGTPTGIPAGAWVFFNSDTLPTNWSRVAGGTFLKGADASGDGGGTGGSSDAHAHTDSGHTHTENAHTHSGTSDQTGSTTKSKNGTGLANSSHLHTVTEVGSATATEQPGVGVVANDDGQPPFYTLNIIQNDTGGVDYPDNMIALWTGTIASIDSNYVLCDNLDTCPDLNNYFIKGATGPAQLGTTGGALSHSHAAGTAHSHTIDSHSHTFSVNATADAIASNGGGGSGATTAHTHANFGVTGGGTTATQTITADTSTDETRPPYYEAAFIQYHQPAGGTLDVVASSSQSFNSAITYQFTGQTSTASNVGAIQVSDTRGGAPGWSLNMQAVDWCKENTCGPGEQHNQLDYDGTGTDDDLGKMCAFPNTANLYAQSGSMTGVSAGGLDCYSSGVTVIDLVTATAGNGTGVYWLTDMSLEQYFPGSPTVQVYTTTLTLTVS